MFSMQFHLPFFVWKRHRGICTDSRKKSDGTALRRSIDLSILGGGGLPSDQGGRKDCLYESQVSFLVAGHSNSAWAGYCFIDTFFHAVEGDDESESGDAEYNETDMDSVEYYNDVEWDNGTLNLDPITAGHFDADMPIWNPREYFLVVLRVRLRQVEEHWQNVAYSLRRKIERDVRDIRSHPAFPREEIDPVGPCRVDSSPRDRFWTNQTRSFAPSSSNRRRWH